jgi:hypothetical protein
MGSTCSVLSILLGVQSFIILTIHKGFMAFNFRIPSVIPRVIHYGLFLLRSLKLQIQGKQKKSVLVLGIYLADRDNAIEHIVEELSKSSNYLIDQKWIALFGKAPSPEVLSVTQKVLYNRMPKYVLLNYLLATTGWRLYDFVIFVDDDIGLPEKFIDEFLEIQTHCNFSVAQPARTHNSFISHDLTEQVDGVVARQTRFVEIGPVVSMNQEISRELLPFDEVTSMGWGFDFVWPKVVEEKNMSMGIIDKKPVEHSMRDGGIYYDNASANKSMELYLSKNNHLKPEEAFVVIKYFNEPISGC